MVYKKYYNGLVILVHNYIKFYYYFIEYLKSVWFHIIISMFFIVKAKYSKISLSLYYKKNV